MHEEEFDVFLSLSRRALPRRPIFILFFWLKKNTHTYRENTDREMMMMRWWWWWWFDPKQKYNFTNCWPTHSKHQQDHEPNLFFRPTGKLKAIPGLHDMNGSSFTTTYNYRILYIYIIMFFFCGWFIIYFIVLLFFFFLLWHLKRFECTQFFFYYQVHWPLGTLQVSCTYIYTYILE